MKMSDTERVKKWQSRIIGKQQYVEDATNLIESFKKRIANTQLDIDALESAIRYVRSNRK